MATKIVTKNSSTASAVPTASDLVQGELAVNVADKRLFTEDNGGSIVELGTNPSTLTVTGEITANGGIALGDNDKATFGDAVGGDLQIYHDGSNSIIEDTSTGNLQLITNGNAIALKSSDGDAMVSAIKDGDVKLYFNNNQKLATTSTGIDVTGTATMDGLTVGIADYISLDGGSAGEVIRTPIAGTLTLESRGSVDIYGDSNNNGTSTSDVFRVLRDSTYVGGTGKVALKVDDSGDISFYEDTGTTPKLFWDASAESLGIGTSSPTFTLEVNGGGAADNLKVESQSTLTNFYQTTSGGTTVFQNNNGSMAMFTGGAERMRIDSSGNVGIGTSSPSSAKMHVETSSGSNCLKVGTATQGVFIKATGTVIDYNASGDAGGEHTFSTGNTERMRIDSSGNVGIGTTSPAYKLDLNGDMRFTSSSALFWGDTNVYEGRTGSDRYWVTGGSERMRIDSSGNLLVGTTTAGFSNDNGWTKEGASVVQRHSSSEPSGSTYIYFTYNASQIGSIVQNGTTGVSYNTSSDQRLKENIADADDAGSKIDAIQVRQYDWKADGSHQDYGMIAQELQTVAPEAVSGDADSEDMMGVDYSKLVPMLVKEIQSLRNRVAQLEE